MNSLVVRTRRNFPHPVSGAIPMCMGSIRFLHKKMKIFQSTSNTTLNNSTIKCQLRLNIWANTRDITFEHVQKRPQSDLGFYCQMKKKMQNDDHINPYLSAWWVFFHAFAVVCWLFPKLTFLKKILSGTLKESNRLDPAQDQHSVGPDLHPNCMQRLSAEDNVRC